MLVAPDPSLLKLDATEDKTEDKELVGETMGTTLDPPFVPTTVVDGAVADSSVLKKEDSKELKDAVAAVG